MPLRIPREMSKSNRPTNPAPRPAVHPYTLLKSRPLVNGRWRPTLRSNQHQRHRPTTAASRCRRRTEKQPARNECQRAPGPRSGRRRKTHVADHNHHNQNRSNFKYALSAFFPTSSLFLTLSNHSIDFANITKYSPTLQSNPNVSILASRPQMLCSPANLSQTVTKPAKYSPTFQSSQTLSALPDRLR